MVNWHLNIISKLEFGDYASKTTIEDYKSAKKIINELSGNISYHKILPNSEVMNILKNTHVGLLPTYADTYGYSVLEAQSFGCPVITTNIRAMPEINNWKKGWIIKVNKDSLNNAKLNTKRAHKFFKKFN